MTLQKTLAVFRTNREETTKLIIQLQNIKLEDELSRKGGGGNVIFIGVFGHVTCSRALA